MSTNTYESCHPELIIRNIFTGNSVSVKVDGKNADIIKILPESTLMIQTTGLNDKALFKVSKKTDRVTYSIENCESSKNFLEDIEIIVTIADQKLAYALDRELTETDEEGCVYRDILKLTSLYVILAEKPIRVRKEEEDTLFEVVFELLPENLYPRETVDKSKLKLYEILKNTKVTLEAQFLSTPGTKDIDLKSRKAEITAAKEKLIEELHKKENCCLYTYVNK